MYPGPAGEDAEQSVNLAMSDQRFRALGAGMSRHRGKSKILPEAGRSSSAARKFA
jgi:hypothetical protein